MQQEMKENAHTKYPNSIVFTMGESRSVGFSIHIILGGFIIGCEYLVYQSYEEHVSPPPPPCDEHPVLAGNLRSSASHGLSNANSNENTDFPKRR